MTKYFYYIRHGESDCQKMHVEDHFRYGLNENGRIQAENVAREIRELNIQRVFSSPIPRALETAKIILPEKKIEIVDNLKECSSEVWQHIWEGASSDKKAEFKQQIFSGVESIKHHLYKETSLIVAHGGVFWGIAQYFDFDFYPLDNVQIIKIPLQE